MVSPSLKQSLTCTPPNFSKREDKPKVSISSFRRLNLLSPCAHHRDGKILFAPNSQFHLILQQREYLSVSHVGQAGDICPNLCGAIRRQKDFGNFSFS